MAGRGAATPATRAADSHRARLPRRPFVRGDRNHHAMSGQHGEDPHVPCAPQAQGHPHQPRGPRLNRRSQVKLPSIRSALHARAELVIPWLANGSLPADAEPAVREHIAGCPKCREDFEEQLRVCQAMRTDGPLVFAAESSYQKLLTRMQNPQVEREPPAAPMELRPSRATYPLRQAPPVVRWLAAAVVLQAFALGLGAWVWHSTGEAGNAAGYTTLTSPSSSYDSGPRVRVLFRPDLSIGALQGVLQVSGAHIIDGPADGNVYTLGFAHAPASRAALEKRVAALRANPAILFAEPVQGGVP